MQQPALAKSTSQLTKWKPYKSWRYPRDLLKSIPEMTAQELDINLVQINLCAYYNPEVQDMIQNKMLDTAFYLKNRYVLENLINTQNKQKGLGEKISAIAKRFDSVYVNGAEFGNNQGSQNEHLDEEDKEIMKEELSQSTKTSEKSVKSQVPQASQVLTEKKAKLKLIAERQKFILGLSSISDKLFQCKEGKTEDEVQERKHKILIQSLEEVNKMLQEWWENFPIKSSLEFSKQISPQNLFQQQKQSNLPTDFPVTPYIFFFKENLCTVTHIDIQNSSFIPTKNRNPLKLDMGFSQFIYKNDDQLSHEIIAMQFIKYMNKIFGSQYIQQYEIMPEVRGAFYECVKARTVAQVKKEHDDLRSYFKVLAEEKGVELSVIQKRFAESYAGFCIAEFMLEIKDRNNANIMVKEDGTLFHIDLAFIFNAKPGGISFESAPFKMTKEYVKAIGGFDSDNFKYFQSLLIQMITKIYQSKDEFLCKLDILGSRSKEIRCFNGFDIQKYKNSKIVKSLQDARNLVEHLIDESFDNWRTKKYDTYQWKTNKIPA